MPFFDYPKYAFDRIVDMIYLVRTCPACRGEGCEKCNQDGQVLTELGAKIDAFIEYRKRNR